MSIEKINFRDQVRDLLLNQMKAGVLAPGDRLSLAKLARDLDVSVTPIREALTQLEQSKIVISIPNRGFIIPTLSKEEALNLYELVVVLESLAIEKSDFSKHSLEQLEKQQAQFESSKNGLDRIKADMKFHELLTANYNNTLVQQLLSEIKTRIFFYEKDFMETQQPQSISNQHHRRIIEYLESGSKPQAIAILKTNWMQILNHLNL